MTRARAVADDAVPPGQTLTVERLAAGGDGIGRIAGKVAFVPLTAPGDLVEVGQVEDRRTFFRARVRRVVRPSPDRVEPVCPAFGVCGGCSWQHLAYRAQLDAKRAIVAEALRRIGRITSAAVADTLPSPQAYGYRHRARLHAGRRDAAVVFGFFKAGSATLVPLEGCPVLHRALEATLRALARAGSRHSAEFARCGEARADTDWSGGAVRLILRAPDGAPLALSAGAAQTIREELAHCDVSLLCGDDTDKPLRLGPGAEALVTTGEAFTQVNLAQNRTLVATALELAAPRPGEETLDLYCGLGNLSLPLSAAGARVLGIDQDAASVRQAQENARRLGRPADFAVGDAAAAARGLSASGRRFPLVLLNPPRTGARETVECLGALAPERIVLVSCDPATLARDAAALLAQGHHLEEARPIDLFPQTAHVETVALFSRRGALVR